MKSLGLSAVVILLTFFIKEVGFGIEAKLYKFLERDLVEIFAKSVEVMVDHDFRALE